MLNSVKSAMAKRPVLFACLGICLLTFINGVWRGDWGAVGGDNDDHMRLIQIENFLAGQSWFDVSQPRMGLDGGTVMHWSRLPDIPIIILTKIFGLGVPEATALIWAIMVWPAMSAAIVIAGLAYGVRRLSEAGVAGPKARLFLFIILTTFLFAHFRFMTGAIDHHNVQLGFMALCVGGLVDPKFSVRSFALAGFAVTVSVGIGVEVYAFAAVMCAYVALVWLLKGDIARDGVQAFGISLAVTGSVIFFGTIAPENYSQIYCEAYSLITYSAVMVGGFGLVGLTVICASRPPLWRWVGSIILGLVCAGLVLSVAPQCLANPLDDLPETTREFWLGTVSEAQPMFEDDVPTALIYFLGVPAIALIVSGWVWTRSAQSKVSARLPYGLIIALLIVSIIMSVYQVRFYVFIHIFAVLPLAVWVGDVFVNGKAKTEDSVAYLFALVASCPIFFLFAAALLAPKETDAVALNAVDTNNVAAIQNADLAQEPDPHACYSDTVLKAYAPYAGVRILAPANATPQILQKTDDNPINGNYHRNLAGIAASLEIYLADVQTAGNTLRKHGVRFFHYCPNVDSSVFTTEQPDGILAALEKGRVPDYFEEILLNPVNSEARIFKIRSK